ncbi:MAG: DUF4380 domain-containing protein [Candidatus Promineifilaceae bacterium]|nr:DUF4380 domain-containing protein [Candidatus Promineifilaceae bacterium]
MTPVNLCTAREGTFRGWEAAFLENGIIRLAAVPDIGGRLMALDLGPYSYLFVDPDLAGKLFSAQENQGDGTLAAWKNYGGDKTWPAPQGWENDQQWHGPPDPVLDTGRYALEALSGDGKKALVRMVSPADRKTGVQISRQFTIRPGSSRVQLELSFRNNSDEPVRWSIWDVVQLRAEVQRADGTTAYDPQSCVTIPLNPDSRFPRGYNVMFGAQENPQWQVDEERQLFIGRYMWEIGKVGLDSTAGWIAFTQGAQGYAFAERFAFEEGAAYPDEGVTVECWTVGAGQVANLDYGASEIYLMETEVLSPLHTINPGESATFAIEWGVCRCLGLVVDVTAGGCVAEPLTVRIENGYAHLTGSFGVFDCGELSLAWVDRQGEVARIDSIGAANPLSAVLLDRVDPLPPEARSVALQVTTTADGQNVNLATAALEPL